MRRMLGMASALCCISAVYRYTHTLAQYTKGDLKHVLELFVCTLAAVYIQTEREDDSNVICV